MKINTSVSVIFMMLLNADVSANVVNIFERNYTKHILVVENDLPIPNHIQFSYSETLLFMEKEIYSFTNLDFTKYKILPTSKEKKTYETFKDKNGNSILNVDGYLVYSTKNTESEKMVISKDHENFKDLSLDIDRGIAYMIGVDHNDSTGRLFVLNTDQTIMRGNQVIVEDISQLGSRLKCLSIDQVNGNVALIEALEGESWKIILLAANDFKLKTEIPSESEEFNKSLASIFNITQSQLQKEFNVAVDSMMDNIISSSAKACDIRLRLLLLENQRLRHHISTVGRVRKYVLEKSICKPLPSENALQMNMSNMIDKRFQSEFKSSVKSLGQNITKMLDRQTVKWLDETADYPLGTDEIKKCGLMTTDDPKSLFPWTVSILKPTDPFTLVCYGTLVHSKVVIPSPNCQLFRGELIARRGLLNVPSQIRKIVQRINFGINVLILDEEFRPSPGKVPVCFPEESTLPSPGSQCKGLKMDSTVESLPAAKMETCPKDFGDLRFICINNHCGEKSNYDAIYCPLYANQTLYFYGAYVSSRMCYDVFVNIGVYSDQFRRGLAYKNINMRELL